MNGQRRGSEHTLRTTLEVAAELRKEPRGHYLNATAAQTPHPDPAQAIPGLVAMVIGGQGFDDTSKRKVRHTFLCRDLGYF